MTQPGIEPRSPGPLVYTLHIWLIAWSNLVLKSPLWGIFSYDCCWGSIYCGLTHFWMRPVGFIFVSSLLVFLRNLVYVGYSEEVQSCSTKLTNGRAGSCKSVIGRREECSWFACRIQIEDCMPSSSVIYPVTRTMGPYAYFSKLLQ